MERQNTATLAQTSVSQNPQSQEAYELEEIVQKLDKLSEQSYDQYFAIIFDSYHQLYQGVWKIFSQRFQDLYTLDLDDTEAVREDEVEMLGDMLMMLNEFRHQQWPIITTYLQKGISYYVKNIDNLVNNCAQVTYETWEGEELEAALGDSAKVRRVKYWARIRASLGSKVFTQKVLLQKITNYYLAHLLLIQQAEYLHAIRLSVEQSVENISHLLSVACKEWEDVIGNRSQGITEGTSLKKSFQTIENEFKQFFKDIEAQKVFYRNKLINIHKRFGQLITDAHQKIGGTSSIKVNNKEEGRIRQSLFAQVSQWKKTQDLWYNKLSSKITLLTVRARLTQLTRIVKNELKTTFFQKSEENINHLREQIQTIVKQHTTPNVQYELVNELFQIKDDLIISDSQLIEGALARAHDAIDDLPAMTTLRNTQTKEPVQISMASLVNYLTQTHFFAPLQEELQNLPKLFKRLYFRVQDSTRLIAFNLQPESLGKRATKDNLSEVLKKAEQDVSLTYQELQLLLERLENHVDRQLIQTLSYLSIDNILTEAERLQKSVRQNARLKSLREVWRDYIQPFQNFFRKTMKFLGIKRARLFTREWEQNNPDQNIHARLRNFVEKVTPKDRILHALPFYYQQLFIGKEILITTILKHRNLELAEAKAAASRLLQGIGGGLLVIGDPLSGKSYFCQHVATHCFPNQHYLIKPPLAGSISVKELTRAFQKGMQQNGSLSQMIESAPLQTVFVLDDLELWWERSEKGIQVLEKIFSLIDQYGKDYFFVVNCNLYSYKLFKQLTNIHLYFASTIQLVPMDSPKVKAVLLDRHFSGANGLEWKGKSYENMSEREVNRLFKRFHYLSNGNIGMALRLWLGNITKVDQAKITIQEPLDQELPKIDDMDWLLILSQFILHKRLTVSQIGRIYQGTDPSILNNLIASLVRAGLIEQVGRHAYQLNSFVTLDVIRQLKDAQLL